MKRIYSNYVEVLRRGNDVTLKFYDHSPSMAEVGQEVVIGPEDQVCEIVMTPTLADKFAEVLRNKSKGKNLKIARR